MKPPFNLTCVTVGSLLKKHRITHVTYMSLDIEGHEMAALRGVDWKVTTIHPF